MENMLHIENYEGLSMISEVSLMESTCMTLYSEVQILCSDIMEDEDVYYAESDNDDKSSSGDNFIVRLFKSIKSILKKIKDFILKIVRSVLSIVLKPFGVQWSFLTGDKFFGSSNESRGGGGGSSSKSDTKSDSKSSNNSGSSREPTVKITTTEGDYELSIANLVDVITTYGDTLRKDVIGGMKDYSLAGKNFREADCYKMYNGAYKNSNLVSNFSKLFKSDSGKKIGELSAWIKSTTTEMNKQVTELKRVFHASLDTTSFSAINIEDKTNDAFENLFNSSSTLSGMFDNTNMNSDTICPFVNSVKVKYGSSMGMIMNLGPNKPTTGHDLPIGDYADFLFEAMDEINNYVESNNTVDDIKNLTDAISYKKNIVSHLNEVKWDEVEKIPGPSIFEKISNVKTEGLKDKETVYVLSTLKSALDNASKPTISSKELNEKNLKTLSVETMKHYDFDVDCKTYNMETEFVRYMSDISQIKNTTTGIDNTNIRSILTKLNQGIEDTQKKREEHIEKKDKDGNVVGNGVHDKLKDTKENIGKIISKNISGDIKDLKMLSKDLIDRYKTGAKVLSMIQINVLSHVVTTRLLYIDLTMSLVVEAVAALDEVLKTDLKNAEGSKKDAIESCRNQLITMTEGIGNALTIKRVKPM
ncbi:MAG: hypothetical protein ACRCZ9_12030 [Fusobacteriaceae bacterium]